MVPRSVTDPRASMSAPTLASHATARVGTRVSTRTTRAASVAGRAVASASTSDQSPGDDAIQTCKMPTAGRRAFLVRERAQAPSD